MSRTHSGPPPPGQIKTLEEIEAEMSGVSLSAPPPTAPPARPQVLSLEEIEQQMMEGMEQTPQQAPPPAQAPGPRQATPLQSGLAGSGYGAPQALLENMFPQLGSAPPPPGQHTGNFPNPANPASGPDQPPQPSREQLARAQALHERITAKIQAMSRYNNCMGSSDKDFITRIQLSQLATADPYTSDFYAQVFSALTRRTAIQEAEGPGVVQVAPGFGFGVGGPTGNRFGKMGNATMSKLSTQVKKLVENRAQRNMSSGESLQIRFSNAISAESQPHSKVLSAKSQGEAVQHLDPSSLSRLSNPNIVRASSSTSRLAFREKP
jgi:DNA topoisomerase 2-associated protein PAT1